MNTHVKTVVAGASTLSIVAMAILFAATPSTAQGDGAAAFKARCASCHGADGSGNTPAGKSMKLRDLRSPDVQTQTDEQLLAVIAKGKGTMPGFESSIGADTCKALTAYVRTLAAK